MLLVCCSKPNNPWEIIEVPLRALKDNEVLIRVHASGMCNLEHFASYAELAPLFCAGAMVFDAIRTTKWSPGDICVVQGIGGLGHLAVQVRSISSGPSKKDLAMSLSAHEHVDSSNIDVVKYIQSLGGAQIIICTAPYAKRICNIIPAVAKNGTVTLVSAAMDKPIEVWNLTLNMNRATICGWCCGCAQDMEKCVRFAT
ncbi:hypothetical protein PC9H_005719 [Pleurotus ostreatus]|uniref:Alcohol dehydrogenase-like C-terminal domain-containing protein n=1 Tax=Pleurotus ostreatus TaxID=5322 RepID=A0A8H6ZZJ1_PLEOS|nr:uncharacterized protein PC9H_005719 [Pleurotus ostreatus]KAF7433754.1 hypothetical protein PC9H_005719 [Pleurotus ostreatus]